MGAKRPSLDATKETLCAKRTDLDAKRLNFSATRTSLGAMTVSKAGVLDENGESEALVVKQTGLKILRYSFGIVNSEELRFDHTFLFTLSRS